MFSALDRLCDSLMVCKCVVERNDFNSCTLSPCCLPGSKKHTKYLPKTEADFEREGISDILMGRRNFTLRAYPFIANIGEPGNGQRGKKGIMVNFLIDTGASDNYMDYATYKLMKFGQLEPPVDTTVVVANGQKIPILGYKLMHVLLPDGRLSRETKFKIVRGLRDRAILGDDFLRLHSAILRYKDRTIGLSDLLKTGLASVPSLEHVAKETEEEEDSDRDDEGTNEQGQHKSTSHATVPNDQHPVSETAIGRGDTQDSTLATVSQ